MKKKISAFFRKQAKEAAKYKKKYAALKNSDGIKIRIQYFNVPIFIFLEIVLIPSLFICTAVAIKNRAPFFSYDMITTLGALALIIAPFVLLSLLNSFFFGKVVCVINDKGIKLIDDFIKWDDITEISYQPGGLAKYRYYSSYAYITVRRPYGVYTSCIDIPHFPFYGLMLLKRRLPEVKMNLTFMWIMLAIPPAIGLLTALIILLGK